MREVSELPGLEFVIKPNYHTDKMKRYISLLVFSTLMMISCNQNQNSTVENFDWLLGSWQRSNETKGRETYEHWSRVSASEYAGFGMTLKDGDTLWYEHIRLVKLDTTWSFQVSGQAEAKPTIFVLTQIKEDMFVSENEQNEFPKKIEYARRDEGLRALISGGDMEVVFNFERMASH